MFEKRGTGLPLQHADHAPYPGDMPVSAHDVAAELRKRIPGLGVKKLHKLLYYCQGHHLATFRTPLFGESIAAWDMGPVVSSLWYAEDRHDSPPEPREVLGEAELNTIGYVLSRYGGLSGQDLENLTHSETPWQKADASRRPRGSVRIELDWITDYFRTAGAADPAGEIVLDSAEVTAMLANSMKRKDEPLRPDNLDDLRARLTARG